MLIATCLLLRRAMTNDFYIYTFAYDVSGIQSLTLHYREDEDGVNPLDDNANEVYDPASHGLSGVGQWINVTMTKTPVNPGNEVRTGAFSIVATHMSVSATMLTSLLVRRGV